MTVQTQIIEVDRHVYPAPKGGFHSPLIKWDGQRFQHEVVIEQAGTNTDDSTTIRYTKRGPDGTVIDTAAIRAQPDADGRPMKHDELGPLQVIIPPGAALGSLIVPYAAHGPADATHNTRVSPWGYVVLRDVYIPHAQGVDPDEVFGMELPGAPTEGGITIEQVRAEVTRGIDAFDQRLGSEAPREDIKGLIEGRLKSLNMWSQSLQDNGLDRFIMQRVYQTFSDNVPGFWPWLRSRVPGAEAEFQAQQAEAAKQDDNPGAAAITKGV